MGNGKSLGYVSDIEINLEKARIDALILPAQQGLFGVFIKNDEVEIKWKDVRVIGEDVILVNLPHTKESPEDIDEINDYPD